MQQTKRKIKLIQPRIQLRLTMVFVGLAALAFTLQFVLFTNALSQLAAILPSDGPLLMSYTNAALAKVLAISFMAFLPLTFAVGILTTFRIAGPLFAIERFLTEIKAGRQPQDVRLRKRDELKHIAALLNEVTAPLRGREGPRPEAKPEAKPEANTEVNTGASRELEHMPSLSNRSQPASERVEIPNS